MAGTLIIAGGFMLLPDGSIRFCDVSNHCYAMTREEYETLKAGLLGKYERKELLEYGEYKLLLAVWNFEIQSKKGIKITNVQTENVLDKINAEVR